MKKYHFIFVVVFLIGCKSNVSIAENIHIKTTPNQFQESPTVNPERTPPVVPDDIEINWRSTIEGNFFDWNGKDLFVQIKGGEKQSVFSRLAGNYCRAEQKGPRRDCYCGHDIRLASVVGNILSIDHRSSFSCAGSYLYWRYASFDLGKFGDYTYPTFAELDTEKPIKSTVGKMISIRDLFSDSEILAALLANQEVAKTISEAIVAKRTASVPENLDEFNAYFAKYDSRIGWDFCLANDFLTRFAFHHIEGSRVAVWVSLTPTSHVGHANQEHIEILLPIPEKLRQPLLLADSLKEGFLMKDAREVVGTSYASFEFGSDKK